jgi:2-phospho-L-lactate transferase/gluconeogenesis factor (CofD/UPF0052 family)
MKIVGIGGGTGLPVLLRGLKTMNEAGESLDITGIVTVADNGGSTGTLRDAFRMPAMGDIRKCMIALASDEFVLTSVCSHRFENPEGLTGHSLGNLILSALYQISGDFTGAIRQASELLQLKGCVLPATEHPTTLCALYEDGGIVRGESKIPQPGRRIQRVWLEDVEPKECGVLDPPPRASHEAVPLCEGDSESGSAIVPLTEGDSFARSAERGVEQAAFYEVRPASAPGVIEALLNADAIVLGPGSLYTSIIPNLLVDGIAQAIGESHATKIYVSNLMTQPGETDGYSAADHVRAILQYVPMVDVCVLNSSTLGTGVAERYLKSGSDVVGGAPDDQDEIRRLGVMPLPARLVEEGEIKARHDPAILAAVVASVARGFTGAQEIICGQRNGR